MTVFLLDTNTCVECLRDHNRGVVARFRSSNPPDLRLCSVVLAEMNYGARKSPHPATWVRTSSNSAAVMSTW